MGKFQTEADEYVHSLTLDTSWLEAETGDVQFGGWFGLVSFNAEAAAEVGRLRGEPGGRCVWTDEGVTGFWGALVTEDSQGFVGVQYLEGLVEADEAWAEVEAAEQAFDDN